MEKNIRILLSLQIALNFLPFVSVFFLFLESNGLTWQQVFIIESIFTASALIVQFPVGMLADRYGRKRVLIVGLMIGTLGFVIYAHAHSFLFFAIADCLIGIAMACHSSTLEPLVYASLKQAGRESEYRKLFGRIQCAGLWTMAVAGVIGGILGAWNLRLALIATIPSYAVGALLALWIEEPRMHTAHVTLPGLLRGIRTNGWMLRAVIVCNAVFLSCTMLFAWFSQPYQKAIGVPMWVIGITQALSLLLSGGASMVAHTLDRYGDERVLLLVCMIVLVVMMAGMALTGGVIGIILMLVGRTCFGAVSTVSSDMLHKLVADDVRSRVQSVQSCLMRAMMIVICLGFGPALDAFTVFQVQMVCAVILCVIMSIALIVLHRAWPQTTTPAE